MFNNQNGIMFFENPYKIIKEGVGEEWGSLIFDNGLIISPYPIVIWIISPYPILVIWIISPSQF